MSAATISSLEDVAQQLVESETCNALVCIAVAGGGGHAISSLASTVGASNILLEGIVTYDRLSFHNYVGPANMPQDDDDFAYVSSEAAHLLSQTALSRAMRYRSSLDQQCRCVGVGASSALVQSKPDRVSRGHVVATHADGRQWECFLKLAPQLQDHHRTRLDEDVMFSRLILQSIEQVGNDKNQKVNPMLMGQDDEFKEWYSPGIPPEDAVRIGAERVLLGETSAVALLPRPNNETFVSVPHVVMPNRTLVFPGSFNPPHVGHVALAKAAQAAYYHGGDAAVLFEMSLINADKPTMDSCTVSERAHQFFELENLPSNWGILLTSAPLFAEKADVLRDSIIAHAGTQRQMAFVIGTDTMVRLLDSKYYGNSQDAMLDALRDMKRHGVHFVVGGRLQQGTEEEDGEKTFVTGEEELVGLPPDVKEMFTLVKEEDFRVDLSSTELRKEMEKKSTRI